MPIEHDLAWDAALTKVAAALSAWRESGPPACGRCGVQAVMSLSVAATEGALYRIAVDWANTEPGWVAVQTDGKSALYCTKCKGGVAGLLKIPPGILRT
jgi:hypothetical protein